MKDVTLIARVKEGRARVTLKGSEGPTAVEPFSRERKRIEVRGYAVSTDGECITDCEASGFLIALPVMDGNTPLVSLTIADEKNQAHIVVDSKGLELIMRHLLEAMKIITLELETKGE